MGMTASWREGSVDKDREHFELRYGAATEGGWDDWIPVATVCRSSNTEFIVQFLDNDHESDMRLEVRRELDFYLIEKGERDPWQYAKYHCGTASNVYSKVHWAYFKDRRHQ